MKQRHLIQLQQQLMANEAAETQAKTVAEAEPIGSKVDAVM